MINESTTLRIKEGHAADFERAVARAVPLFQQSTGALGFKLERTLEDPLQYVLIVGWASVEAHTEGFRGSEAFASWRELVGGHFDTAPTVRHTAHVLTGF